MLKPIGDHILVKPISREEMTKAGIVLPDTAKEKPQEGKIVALGRGKFYGDELVTYKDMGLEVGQVVMFTKYGPTEIEVDGEEYYILEANDILGVIESGKAKK